MEWRHGLILSAFDFKYYTQSSQNLAKKAVIWTDCLQSFVMLFSQSFLAFKLWALLGVDKVWEVSGKISGLYFVFMIFSYKWLSIFKWWFLERYQALQFVETHIFLGYHCKWIFNIDHICCIRTIFYSSTFRDQGFNLLDQGFLYILIQRCVASSSLRNARFSLTIGMR